MPPSLSPRFRRARRLHDAGDLDSAQHLYADMLRRDPQHFDALHLLGMLHYQRGALESAIKLLQAALAVDAGSALTRRHGCSGARERELNQKPEALLKMSREAYP